MKNITFKVPWQFDDNNQTIFNVNVSKFNKDWSKDIYFYIGENGCNSISEKRNRLIKILNQDSCCFEMPYVSISRNIAGVIDGRHRFSLLRDSGVLVIPCIIPKKQENIFKKRYS